MSRWATRNSGHRASVRHFLSLSKGIRDGTRVPVVTLQNLGSIADSVRRRLPDGTLEPFEESWLWPLYARFHPIRLRWIELRSRGDLTPALADELQVEMYEAACEVLGESRSHRPTRALVMYEGGRIRADHPEAVGMANFVNGMSAGRLDLDAPLGSTLRVSAKEPNAGTDLTL